LDKSNSEVQTLTDEGQQETEAASEELDLAKQATEEAQEKVLKREEDLKQTAGIAAELKQKQTEKTQEEIDNAAAAAASNAANEALMKGMPQSEVVASAQDAANEAESNGLASAAITNTTLLNAVLQPGNSTAAVDIAINAVGQAEKEVDEKDDQVDSAGYQQEDAGTGAIMTVMNGVANSDGGATADAANDAANRQTRLAHLNTAIVSDQTEEDRRQSKTAEGNSETKSEQTIKHAAREAERARIRAAVRNNTNSSDADAVAASLLSRNSSAHVGAAPQWVYEVEATDITLDEFVW